MDGAESNLNFLTQNILRNIFLPSTFEDLCTKTLYKFYFGNYKKYSNELCGQNGVS